MRASDGDRDRVVAVLRRATAEGYLTLDEFEERLDQTLGSRYLADLDALLEDIPGAPRPSRWQQIPVGPPPGPAPSWEPPWGRLTPFQAAVRLLIGLLLVVLVMSALAHMWFPPLPLVVFGFLYWRRVQRRHHGATDPA